VETGFNVHVGINLAAAILVGFYCHSSLDIAPAVLALPLSLFVASAAVPDVDCASSRPRKYVRFGAMSCLVFLSAAYFSTLSAWNPVLPFVLPFLGVLALELAMPAHRAILHSPLAAVGWGAFFFFAFGSPLTGLLAGLGYASHLVVDALGDRT